VPVKPRMPGRLAPLPRAAAGQRSLARTAGLDPMLLPTEGQVLVIDGDRQVRQGLLELLERRRLRTDVAASADTALKKVQKTGYDAVFLDQRLPPAGGMELVPRILRIRPDASVVFMARHGTAASNLGAMKQGAFHCVAKPVEPAMLDLVLRSCLERARLMRQNADLQLKTIQDDLTTAYNRRHLDASLDEELERDQRYGRTFSIIFFDLDRLKEVNDKYGHLAGSRVLREVAHLIQGKLRKSDRIFRYGGDEFVVTLPETGSEGAVRVAHRLRRTLRSHRFLAAEGHSTHLTASFGVATFPQDGSSQEELIRVADQAMYRIKTQSRDGVAWREA
jgi:diguanylate cyclase (GGDEF)-like protein